MKMVIDELVTLLGLELAPGVLPKIRAFESMIGQVAKTTMGLSASLIGAATGAFAFATKMNNISFGLQRVGQLSGISTDELQKWTAAAVAAGGNAEDIAPAIARLQAAFNPAMPGNYSDSLIRMSEKAGETSRNMVHSPMEAMIELNRLAQKLSATDITQFASGTFSEDLIALAMRPTKEFLAILEKAQKTTTLISPEQLKNATKFKVQLGEIENRLKTFSSIVSSVAAPAMEALVGDLDKWLIKSKEWVETHLPEVLNEIVHGFQEVGVSIGKTTDYFGEFIGDIKKNNPALNDFIKWLESCKIIAPAVELAIYGLAASLTAMAAGMALAHPWVMAFSVLGTILTYVISNWEGLIKTGNEWFAKTIGWIETTQQKVEKLWASVPGMKDKFLYTIASEGNKARMDQANPMLNYAHLYSNQGQSGATIHITQNIGLGNAMEIAAEATRKITQALDNFYPGAQVPVVN